MFCSMIKVIQKCNAPVMRGHFENGDRSGIDILTRKKNVEGNKGEQKL